MPKRSSKQLEIVLRWYASSDLCTHAQDRYRHSSLHNFSTEFHGHQNRKIGQSQVTEAKPVSFYRELEPNKYLNAPDIEGARYVPPCYSRVSAFAYMST